MTFPRAFAVLLLLLFAGAGGTALGHANYVKSNPGADARLTTAPKEIRISFSESPDPRGSEIQVLSTTGGHFERRDLGPSDEVNGLRISVGPMPDAGYIVAWTAVSAVDGHETKGTFVFAIGDAPLPPLPDVPDAVPAPTPLEIGGRALSFAGVALALGIVLFGALVHESRDPRELSRERIALALGGGLLIAGTALLVLDQGARLPTRLALLLATRAAAGLVIVMAQRGPLASLLPTGPKRLLAHAAGLAAALSLTLVSHAAASGTALALVLDLAHVLAISAWLGGIVGVLWILLPGARATGDLETRALGRTVRRFSILAIAAVITLVVTGTVASLSRLVLVEDLWETPYGIALSAKVVLLVATLGVGSLNLLVWGPRLLAGHDGMAMRRGLTRGTLVEGALLSVVLVAAAFLTSFAPPASASGAAFDETRHAGDLRLELLVPSTLPGRNRFVLRVHEGLAPVTGAEKVALRFTMVEHDMGESELVTTERAPGEYVAEGSPTAMYGTWRAEAIVRRTGRLDVRTVFSVPIAPPFGQAGVVARALPLGSYTFVTFLEPSTPSAGAPLTLSVVLVDSTGNPVPGRMLRASFQGPSTAPAIDAKESTVGRYVFAIPALAAGTWQAMIAMGTDGSVTYGFEVAR